MNNRLNNIFVGLVLIVGGGVVLAQNLGFLQQWSAQSWMWICSGLSLAFLIMYILNGVRNWGWLFPASIFGGVALTILLGEREVHNTLVPLPILISVALPFVVAFGIAPNRHWWALIPIWTIGIISAIVGLSNIVAGEWIAALILYGIAIPFVVTYVVNRNRRWALLPAFVLAAAGTLPVFATRFNGQLVGALVLVMVALPFLFVFALSGKNWWALIPAGILISIALEVFLTGTERYNLAQGQVPVMLMFVGWALTFGALWLQRTKQSTDWAKYPALLCALVAVIVAFSNTGLDKWWPVLLILGGLLTLLINVRSNKLPPAQS